jgi:hypothetical protein
VNVKTPSDARITLKSIPPAPSTTASGEAGFLSCLTRSELADLWVERLKRARAEEEALGKRNLWTRVGRRAEVRVVEREFVRRIKALAEEREEYERLLPFLGHDDPGQEQDAGIGSS